MSVVPSEFEILNAADEQQIRAAESAVKQALVYESRGKKQITFAGIKWIILKMSQAGQPISLSMPDVFLEKHDPEDKSTWIWYATIKAKNEKTGLETIGTSEQCYIESNKYDTFGRTKAVSKAERNAYRKQIPELEIQAMMNSVEDTDVQNLDQQQSAPPQQNGVTPPTDKQLNYLKGLGHTGPTPKTMFEAGKLIEALKARAVNK